MSGYNISTAANGDIYVTDSAGIWFATGNHQNCTLAHCPLSLSVYDYRPTLAGSIALIVLYGICAAIQTGLGVYYRQWGFMTATVLGCLTEILGYVGRIMYYHNPWEKAGFIMQIVLITIGPVFFAAAVYIMSAKIMYYISPEHARFEPKFIYYGFIGADIISLVLQAVGGAMSSTSNGNSQTGVNIALAGLSFQVATLAIFVIVMVDYLIRSRSVWRPYHFSLRFKSFAFFLTLALLTIWIRCCYRVYELSDGYTRTSSALHDQGLFIGLEMVMIIVAAYCLIFAHPGPVFGSPYGDQGPAAEKARLQRVKFGSQESNSDEAKPESNNSV